MQKWNPLTRNVERVIELRSKGNSLATIAKLTNLDGDTVRVIVQNYSPELLGNMGVSRARFYGDKNELFQIFKPLRDRGLTYSQIAASVHKSVPFVRHILIEYGKEPTRKNICSKKARQELYAKIVYLRDEKHMGFSAIAAETGFSCAYVNLLYNKLKK